MRGVQLQLRSRSSTTVTAAAAAAPGCLRKREQNSESSTTPSPNVLHSPHPQEKTYAPSLEVSRDGEQLVVFAADKKIRVFRFRTVKLRRCYDESLAAIQEVHRQAQVRVQGGWLTG